MTPRERFQMLDEISRIRALTDAESRELEVLQRRLDAGGGDRRPWTREEERALSLVDRSHWGWAKRMAPIFRRSEAALYLRATALAAAAAPAADGHQADLFERVE